MRRNYIVNALVCKCRNSREDHTEEEVRLIKYAEKVYESVINEVLAVELIVISNNSLNTEWGKERCKEIIDEYGLDIDKD